MSKVLVIGSCGLAQIALAALRATPSVEVVECTPDKQPDIMFAEKRRNKSDRKRNRINRWR